MSSAPLRDDGSWPEAPGPGRPRQARLAALLYAPEAVRERSRRIYEAVLDESPRIRAGNFATIGADDLERLFHLYFGLLHTAFASSMRYRTPGEVPAMGLAAAGLLRLAGGAPGRPGAA